MERESVGLNDKVDIDWRTICTLGKVEKYMGNLIKAMEYYENKLLYEDYCELRKSVGWLNFPEVQTKKALERSFYTVTVFNQGELIAMGRLLGDGGYCTIVDVVVRPEYKVRE